MEELVGRWRFGLKPEVVFFPEITFKYVANDFHIRLTRLAGRAGMHVGYGAGLAEQCGGGVIENEYFLARPDGTIMCFLKRDLGDGIIRARFPGFSRLQLGEFSLGLSLCRDVLNPAVRSQMHNNGEVDIVVVPVAFYLSECIQQYAESLGSLLPRGNFLFINQAGSAMGSNENRPFAGLSAWHSFAATPPQKVELSPDQEGLIIVDLYK
jgi:predicted amidohydrolase